MTKTNEMFPGIVLNGALREALLLGSKIIFFQHTGADWHVLVELVKGGKWRYCIYETVDGEFHAMRWLNYTPKQAVKEFSANYHEARQSFKLINKN